MSSDIDAQLSNFFDENNPETEFDIVLRGYDRTQVNEYLAQLRQEGRQAREEAEKLRKELAEAKRQLQEQERPTYSGLGARIEQLL
ncbi:DivIVA domain-containing protein, partial [Algoriphagus aestuarii]|nr:DivIVA domain-containing protein [Algoriphagus aestuarii]